MILPINTFIEEEAAEKAAGDSVAGVIRLTQNNRIVTDTQAFFGPGSPLGNAVNFGGRPYEYRRQQNDMAAKTAEAFATGNNLCIEAPTGVGKSFAYLVPAIYYALAVKLPVVISTETINLQEQLIDKDIPLLRKMMSADFTAALAKGRGNYLCLRRLALASGDRKDEFLPLPAFIPDIAKLSRWADKTFDGSKNSVDCKIDPVSWSCVCCEGGNCAGPKCDFYKSCFYWKARRQWEKVNVIVANHALFFTDLKMKQSSDLANCLLPSYGGIVIDEAHTLENNAAEYLGLRLSGAGFNYFLNRLFNPELGKGLLVKAGQESLEIRRLVSSVKEKANTFFHLTQEFLQEKQDSLRRVRKACIFPDLVSSPLRELELKLHDYTALQEDKDFKTELEAQLLRCKGYQQEFADFIAMSLPEHVYWIEQEKNSVSLHASPLNINALLQKNLFTGKIPVILTSATLTVRRRLDYFRGRVGFTGGDEMVLDSPFSPDQVTLHISKSIPEPVHNEYFDALVPEIEYYVSLTHGKAFVLFTSHQLMRQCADVMAPFFAEKKIRLLVQGDDLNRSAMLREFKEDINSVLFGADSFWTGVDVPGEALSNVIVTKFPFAVPSHPLIEARSEQLEAAGLSSFMEYSLPEAVLKFRQGIGRLIRSSTDRGIIVILDRRAVSKRYGRLFLDSIPPYPVQYR